MNIEDLTLGQIREIQNMGCAVTNGDNRLAANGDIVIAILDRGWMTAHQNAGVN